MNIDRTYNVAVKYTPEFQEDLSYRFKARRLVASIVAPVLVTLLLGSIWFVSWKMLVTAVVLFAVYSLMVMNDDEKLTASEWRDLLDQESARAEIAESKLRTYQLEREASGDPIPEFMRTPPPAGETVEGMYYNPKYGAWMLADDQMVPDPPPGYTRDPRKTTPVGMESNPHQRQPMPVDLTNYSAKRPARVRRDDTYVL
jgi:hypothetical protein